MVVWLENSSLNRLGDYIRLGCVDGKVPFHLSFADTSDTVRVDVRTYLLGGAIDSSEANGIIRGGEFINGENELKRIRGLVGSTKEDELRLCDIFVEWHGVVGSECDAKRKHLDGDGYQKGNGAVLAIVGREQRFIVYYDDTKLEFEACLKREKDKVRTSIWRDVKEPWLIEEAYTKYSIHPGADTMLCGFRLTNRWLSMKKDIASCSSKYLAYSEVEVEYQGSSVLLLQPELPE
ncbi:hypothetical protein Tco_0044803 [Tanacetum coccineum]